MFALQLNYGLKVFSITSISDSTSRALVFGFEPGSLPLPFPPLTSKVADGCSFLRFTFERVLVMFITPIMKSNPSIAELAPDYFKLD